MKLVIDVEQANLDAFARLIDLALKNGGVVALQDAAWWMGTMQTVVNTPSDEPLEEAA